VFWIAVIPAFLSFGLILVAVQEPERKEGLRRVRMPLSRSELGRLGLTYWWVAAVAAVFTLARFSEAFLVLRAQSIGLPLMLVPVVLVIMNIAYAVSAYPVGALSDRVGRVTILILGLLLSAGRRSGPRLRTGSDWACRWRGPLGPAHGVHSRFAGNPRGGHGT
jgi:MFS family permease